MRPTRSTLAALIACAAMTASCAGSRPASEGASPPRLVLPATAASPCALPRLPSAGEVTQGELEAAYIARGAAVVACEAARGLAVGTLEAERAAIDAWLADRAERTRERRWWPF